MKRIISGRAGGPYSPAVIAGGFCFVAGQVGDGADAALVDGVESQTARTLDNVKAILDQAGVGMADVVRTTVFLADMDDFQAMNAVYATFFPDEPPARVTVQVARLPIGAAVEIDAVAVMPAGN